MWHNVLPHVAGLHNQQTFTANYCGIILECKLHQCIIYITHIQRQKKERNSSLQCKNILLFSWNYLMQPENIRNIHNVVLLKQQIFDDGRLTSIIFWCLYVFCYYSSVHDIALNIIFLFQMSNLRHYLHLWCTNHTLKWFICGTK